MIEKTINYNNKELIRINYTKVKNIINNKSKLKKDIIIYTLPNKANHKSPWINGFFEIEVPKDTDVRFYACVVDKNRAGAKPTVLFRLNLAYNVWEELGYLRLKQEEMEE